VSVVVIVGVVVAGVVDVVVVVSGCYISIVGVAVW